MPHISPYRALFYSASQKSKIQDLVSPPYDVISKDEHERLKNRDPHNSVRLCLVESAEDPSRYQKMKATFENWKKEKVLEPFSSPAFYLLEENFIVDGENRKRIGFVGLLEVSPFEKKEVLPHEFTLSGPKADRLELLKTMGAEFSQIFLCYRDSAFVLEKIHEKLNSSTPAYFDLKDPTGVHRKLWPVTDSAQIEQIKKMIANQSVLIADGHHRYETAIAYSKEQPEKGKWAQCYFTNLGVSGFTILPIHRLFSLPAGKTFKDFSGDLSKIFKMEDWNRDLSLKAIEDLRKKEPQKIHFFLASENGKKIQLLSRDKKSDEDAEIFSLQEEIFEKILGWDISKMAKGAILYEHETDDFKKTLSKLENGVGFFLPATDLQLVMKRALEGKRMPQKSTFFYPKIASGLVNYELGSI